MGGGVVGFDGGPPPSSRACSFGRQPAPAAASRGEARGRAEGHRRWLGFRPSPLAREGVGFPLDLNMHPKKENIGAGSLKVVLYHKKIASYIWNSQIITQDGVVQPPLEWSLKIT